jgi:hypothetical protein
VRTRRVVKAKNVKQWASWMRKCSAAYNGNFESGVCATVEDSERETKPASCSEIEYAFSELNDGISGEMIDRTEATSSSNELTSMIHIYGPNYQID